MKTKKITLWALLSIVTMVSLFAVAQAEAGDIAIKQGKFTFYFGNRASAFDRYYNGLDRFSTTAYLQKKASEPFVMPFNKDVTVFVEVPDSRHSGEHLQIFSQTIPAGTVAGTTKYRYTGGMGIRDLTFESYYSTSVYMYIFVDRVDYLLDIKPTMTPYQYRQFVRSIKSYTMTVEIGDIAWVGSAPLVPGTYSDHKQELVYNR